MTGPGTARQANSPTVRAEVGPSLTLLAAVAELLRDLDPAELTELIEGRARLAVVPRRPGTGRADGPAPEDTGLPAPTAGRPAPEDTRLPAPTAGAPGRAPAARTAGAPGRAPAARTAGAPDVAGTARRGAVAVPDGELDRARAALAAMTSRDQGAAYLSTWTVGRLRALAAVLALRGVTGLRKSDLIERIVGQTIAFRLSSSAIRRL